MKIAFPIKIPGILFIALITFGCGGDNPSSSEPETEAGCLITQIESDFGDGDIIITLEYDSSGNLLSATDADGNITTYEYSGNTIIVNDGSIITTTTLEGGLIMNIRREDINDAGIWQNIANEYNGQELIKQIQTDNEGGERNIFYEWENGNMVKKIIPDFSTNPYEYHLDQPIQAGDVNKFAEIRAFGATLLKNTNLLKSAFGIAYEYSFDEDGKIRSYDFTYKSSGSTYTTTLTYGCD